jgi:hypothetical protein
MTISSSEVWRSTTGDFYCVSWAAVRRSRAPLNVSHLDQALLGGHVKEDPPITDATAKGGRLI